METIDDVLVKRYSKSLVAFMKLVDPERKFSFEKALRDAWDNLSLIEQQRLYLYLLYRKWRGLDIYGEPYYIITNCHPAPFNWNGVAGINTLMKQNKLVIAKHNGSYGTYTRDEAKVWLMTDVKPLNF
jgi:hypothetical protein